MNKASASMLMHQFLGFYSSRKLNNEIYEGVIQQCNLTEITRSVSESCVKKCQKYYLKHPKVEIQSIDSETGCESDILATYIPKHLKIIISEILKNSLRATVEKYDEGDIPNITILIVKGKSQITIKISDQAGGASLLEQKRYLK